MNSFKHAIVALLLLGVSYGVYQAITFPDPVLGGKDSLVTDGLVIENGDVLGNVHAAPSQFSASTAPVDNAQAGLSRQLPPNNSSFAGFSTAEPNGRAPNSFQAPTSTSNPVSAPPLAGMDGGESRGSTPTIPNSSGFGHQSPPLLGPPPVMTSDQNFSLAGGGQPSGGTVALTGGGSTTAPLPPLEMSLHEAHALVRDKDFRGALQRLTPYVRDTSLTATDRETLLEWVDALALKVIYSTEHLWYQPHTTSAGDTLDSLAAQWRVPPQLIYYINRASFGAHGDLTAGMTIKKVTGPFHAELPSNGGELTLYVDECYAGRFRLAEALPQQLPTGVFTIEKKEIGSHPAGTYWMGTNHLGVSLHAPGFGTSGGIVFAPDDARDLFGILSIGSQITIR